MAKRKVEVFTSGCYLCEETVKLVKEAACPNCEVVVYDLTKGGRQAAEQYGVNAVPTIVVDGKIVDCCEHGKVSKEALMAAGVGR